MKRFQLFLVGAFVAAGPLLRNRQMLIGTVRLPK